MEWLLNNESVKFLYGLGTHLFVKVPLGDSEVTFSAFESSCHLLLVEAIPLSPLTKDITSELAGQSPH